MKKQVVFISFSLGETSVSDYFLELTLELSKTYKVVVFSDRQLPEGLVIPSEIEIKYWPSKRPTKYRDFMFLMRAIKEYKPQLTISIFGSVNIFLLAGFLSGVKNRVAWIRTLTTQFPQKKHLLIRKRIVYKLATQIITNSEATKQDAVQNYQIPEYKVKVLPNSVKDYYDYIAIDTEIPTPKITYVGRLHKSKGVSTLIEAFNMISKEYPSLSLDIIGNGPEKESLLLKIKNLGLEDKVFLKGALPKKDVLKAFKTSYLAVVPSTSEAFGFTVIEAMSMKTCVIGANNTGIKEIIIDNQTGLLFDTENHIDLAQKMRLVLNNKVFREELAVNGYNRFLVVYENKKSVKRDNQFFSDLLES